MDDIEIAKLFKGGLHRDMTKDEKRIYQLECTLREILKFCNHLHNDCKYNLNDGHIRKIKNICKRELNDDKIYPVIGRESNDN